jgi:ribosomal protein L37AE/L43A
MSIRLKVCKKCSTIDIQKDTKSGKWKCNECGYRWWGEGDMVDGKRGNILL